MTVILRVLFSLLFAGAGLYLFRAAALVYLRRGEWLRRGVIVDGEVTGMHERKSTSTNNPHSTYAPVVSFIGTDGRRDRFTSSESERPARYAVGDKVKVRVLGADAEIDGVTRSVWPLLALLLLATVCVVIAVLPFVLPHRA